MNSFWVWREDKIKLPDATPDGKPWPKISIVTPSYNQGQYIEETIRSVLMQGYPNLEYIIIDGGSTDNTVEIIKQYEQHLTYWVSEKDNGQTHAINKGFEKATGDILAYLNSDDVYMPYTLRLVAELFSKFNIKFLTGHRSHLVDQDVIAPLPTATYKFNSHLYQKGFHVQELMGWNQQPSTFWSAALFNKCGREFNESMQCSFDIDMWIQFAKHTELIYLRSVLAMMRQHAEQKSRTLNLINEVQEQAKRHKFYTLWWRRILVKCSTIPLLRKIVRALLQDPTYSIIDWDPILNAWSMKTKPMI